MHAAESLLPSTAGDLAVPLDGAWQIAPDSANRGETERWFDAATLPQTQANPIQVPGVIAAPRPTAGVVPVGGTTRPTGPVEEPP